MVVYGGFKDTAGMYLTFDVQHLSDAVSLGIPESWELSKKELRTATDTQYAGTSVFEYIKVMTVYMCNRLKPAESRDLLISLWSIDSLITHLSERSAIKSTAVISDVNDSHTALGLAYYATKILQP